MNMDKFDDVFWLWFIPLILLVMGVLSLFTGNYYMDKPLGVLALLGSGYMIKFSIDRTREWKKND